MKSKTKILIYPLLLLVVFVWFLNSCKKEKEVITPSFPQKTFSEGSGMTVLGYQLQNPYSVANMTQAYNNIRVEDTSVTLNITTTHIYVRFLPQTDQEYDTLAWNDDLELFDYPLDYSIVSMGDYYHDPSIPDSNYTYQYCVLPNPVVSTGVTYEILANLFIPDRDRCETDEVYEAFIDKLEAEALRITNNLEYDNTERTYKLTDILPSKYNPCGLITVYDNITNTYVPVEGAKARVYRWFETRSAYTNSQGLFVIPNTFRYLVNYSVIWQTDDYNIRRGYAGVATTNGPKQRNAWFKNIWVSDQDNMYATIHRAAYYYYYKINSNGIWIQTPPKNTWYRSKLQIAAVHSSELTPHENPGITRPTDGNRWPQITMYDRAYQSSVIYNSDVIIYRTCHELAHASHWDLCVRNSSWTDWDNCQKKVAESWAKGVGWKLTTSIYLPFGLSGYTSYLDGYQHDNIADYDTWSRWDNGYSPLVIDLFDNINQRNDPAYSIAPENYAPDNVTGFTFYEIENALKGATTLDEWKANLKLLNKVPDADLDNLFAFYTLLNRVL